MVLREEVLAARSEIKSDGYPMSIGELINLYRDKELDIHPEFQRFFRWSPDQKSRLVESLLLGIPIPSIFVAQRQDGVWDVIDGLQRLSTIFQFVGILRDESGTLLPPLVLNKTKYLPSLEGKKWEDEQRPEISIGADHQLIIKRSKIDVKIILRESDETAKFELFQRLNTGGSPLSDQELRNCILITIDQTAFRWIAELSKDANFKTAVALSDRLENEQYDLELVVRFLIFRRINQDRLGGIGDIGEFLTDELIALVRSGELDRGREETAFRKTFEVLANQLGDDSFRRYNHDKGRYEGPFLLSAYEVLAIGLGYHIDTYLRTRSAPNVTQISQSIWRTKEFTDRTGSGVRASSRIPSIIPLGRNLFKP